MEIRTREFSIDDYDNAVQLWKRVEGIEIAEGDDVTVLDARIRLLPRRPQDPYLRRLR